MLASYICVTSQKEQALARAAAARGYALVPDRPLGASRGPKRMHHVTSRYDSYQIVRSVAGVGSTNGAPRHELVFVAASCMQAAAPLPSGCLPLPTSAGVGGARRCECDAAAALINCRAAHADGLCSAAPPPSNCTAFDVC